MLILGVGFLEFVLLSGSVMENIRFARGDATDEEVRAAAIAANADEFMATLPEGYNMTDLRVLLAASDR